LDAKGKILMHSKEEERLRWGFLACAMLIASAGGIVALGPWTVAAADEALAPDASLDSADGLDADSLRAKRLMPRRVKQKARDEAALEAEGGDAKRFSDRLKRHHIRSFVRKRRNFRKHLLRLEKQRHLRRARIKARQFAAARRRAAKHARRRSAKPKVRVQHRASPRLTQKVD
jgi:hypothetical protein